MRMILALATVIVALMAHVPPSAAGKWSPWCAQYFERGGGTRVCAFNSYGQCAATVRGIGGICSRNFPPEAYERGRWRR